MLPYVAVVMANATSSQVRRVRPPGRAASGYRELHPRSGIRRDDRPSGILDFGRPAWQNLRREPGLPRPGSLWCRTASPVAVRHHSFHLAGHDLLEDPMTDPDEPTSARPRAARRPPTWELLWNNPKLHTPDRRKIWLACDEHRAVALRLPRRAQFLKDVVPQPRSGPSSSARVQLIRRWPTSAGRAAGTSGRRCRGRRACRASRPPSARRSPRRWRRRAARARRSDSSRAKRQLRIWPSAVSRTRSQSPQNGRVTDAITPTVAGPPSTWNSSAGALPRGSSAGRQHELAPRGARRSRRR